MTDLATEEARAMAGRPAWRVAAACIKGVNCPRCKAMKTVRCWPATCCERVWRQRARERSARPSPVGVHAFLEAVAAIDLRAGVVFWWDEHYEVWRITSVDMSESMLAPAIRGGLVRLTVSNGVRPEWVVTEHGEALAREFGDLNHEQSEPAVPPIAPAVDAEAATAAFLERTKP